MKLEEEKDSGGTGIVLLKRIWAEVKKLRREEIFALITEPSVALFDAIKSESHDQVIDTFLDYITILTTVKDPQGRNLLHLLCLHRRRAFSDKRVNNRKEQLVGAVDNEGNNVLHMAALFSVQFQSFSGLNPYLQMQKALKWFKVNSFISLFLFNHSLLLFYCRTSVPQIFTYFLLINRKWRVTFLVN